MKLDFKEDWILQNFQAALQLLSMRTCRWNSNCSFWKQVVSYRRDSTQKLKLDLEGLQVSLHLRFRIWESRIIIKHLHRALHAQAAPTLPYKPNHACLLPLLRWKWRHYGFIAFTHVSHNLSCRGLQEHGRHRAYKAGEEEGSHGSCVLLTGQARSKGCCYYLQASPCRRKAAYQWQSCHSITSRPGSLQDWKFWGKIDPLQLSAGYQVVSTMVFN